MVKLSDFTFISKYTFIPKGKAELVQTPTFIEGELADTIYQDYEAEKAKLNNNLNFRLEKESRVITGSTIFDSALINKIVKPYGLRTALPQDLNEEVLNMVKDKHYVDANALILRSLDDSACPKNNFLAKTLADLIGYEESKGPVLITSLTLESAPEDKNYGLKLIPSDNSKVIYDKRLSGKYNGWNFNTIDELGLPKDFDETKGSRTWYARSDGLSGLFLDRFLVMVSGASWYWLVDSAPAGRIILVSNKDFNP